MSAEVQRVLEAAMKLTDTERAQLLVVLADSLGEGASGAEILQAWTAEARRRLEQIEAGASSVTPAAEVFRRGRAMIDEAKRQRAVG